MRGLIKRYHSAVDNLTAIDVKEIKVILQRVKRQLESMSKALFVDNDSDTALEFKKDAKINVPEMVDGECLKWK